MSKLIHQHQCLKESVQLAIKEITGFEGLASDILTRVVIETINRYQQKLGVGLQDSVADLLDTFKYKVAEAVFNKADVWRVANRDCFLFPKGCRFSFTRGDTAITVIEQDPQIRSILFGPQMLGRESTSDDNNTTDERIALAMPYVLFILKFKGNVFKNLYTAWRVTPLRSLDDGLNQALLPNIHDGGNVCMGTTFRPSGVTLSEMTDSTISYYWNSKFNHDLSAQWWSKGGIDRRLESARTWSDCTIDNPMFMLDVNLPIIEGRTVRSLLDLLTVEEFEPDENKLRQDLAEAIDNCVEGLSSKILRYFKKTKFDRHHPKDISDALINAMQAASREVVDLLYVIQHELGKMEKELRDSKSRGQIVPQGRLWTDYSP